MITIHYIAESGILFLINQYFMELHVGILNTAQLMMITDIFFVRLLPVASLFGGIVDINLDVF